VLANLHRNQGATEPVAGRRDRFLTMHHAPLLLARESSIVRAEIEVLFDLESVY
jgi:hypothetical protein